jgi:CMP-N,N'-diacetyllegionaminic acid synthase
MIAIIPARGGSKGVPRKNIRPLCGKPLIQWTIDAAKNATRIDQVILSTDDEEIAEVCRPMGVEIPFMRPMELAQDDSLAIDNYIYTVDRLIDELNWDIEEYAVLLPTAPFRNSRDIDASIEIFCEKKADSVISCTQLVHPISWVCAVDGDGKLKHIKNNRTTELKEMMNRQESEASYIPNGGVYVFRHSLLKKNYSYYSDKTYSYIMPAERSVDIDTELDFEFSEWRMRCELG